MKFVPSLRTKRTGRSPADFLVVADDVEALRVEGHTTCEFLHESVRTKLYLDFDHVLDEKPDGETVKTIKDRVLKNAKEIADTICMHDFVVASRHGPKGEKFKVSFRVFFKGFSLV